MYTREVTIFHPLDMSSKKSSKNGSDAEAYGMFSFYTVTIVIQRVSDPGYHEWNITDPVYPSQQPSTQNNQSKLGAYSSIPDEAKVVISISDYEQQTWNTGGGYQPVSTSSDHSYVRTSHNSSTYPDPSRPSQTSQNYSGYPTHSTGQYDNNRGSQSQVTSDPEWYGS